MSINNMNTQYALFWKNWQLIFNPTNCSENVLFHHNDIFHRKPYFETCKVLKFRHVANKLLKLR